MVSLSVRYLSYQPMDEKIKTWTLCFPAKQNPNMGKVLFYWQSCCSMLHLRSLVVSVLFARFRCCENRSNGLKGELYDFCQSCSKSRAALSVCNRCVLCVA